MEKLKELCNKLQNIDPNGFYFEIIEEVEEGTLPIEDAYSEIYEIIDSWIEEIGEDVELKNLKEEVTSCF